MKSMSTFIKSQKNDAAMRDTIALLDTAIELSLDLERQINDMGDFLDESYRLPLAA